MLYFLLISHNAGKVKQIEKHSACRQLAKQVYLQYRITNCTISQDICTPFAIICTILCALG